MAYSTTQGGTARTSALPHRLASFTASSRAAQVLAMKLLSSSVAVQAKQWPMLMEHMRSRASTANKLHALAVVGQREAGVCIGMALAGVEQSTADAADSGFGSVRMQSLRSSHLAQSLLQLVYAKMAA